MAGSGQGQARPPVVPVSVLGLLTIVAYGTCYYAYGVLIGPIRASTRWPDAALGASWAAGRLGRRQPGLQYRGWVCGPRQYSHQRSRPGGLGSSGWDGAGHGGSYRMG